MNSSLEQRLSIVPEDELRKLLGMFKEHTIPEFNAGMTDHFRIAKEKPAAFANHPEALGVSVGGSNTKIMLASMKDGIPVLRHATAAANPPQKIHLYDFFDENLLGDPIFRNYLEKTPRPVVGISVPTSVWGKIPFHETKVPTIDGLLARGKSQMTDEYDLGKNFAKYLRLRNLPEATLFYQADGIVAHHGAVSLCDMDVDDRSTLFVCGTGMATGDEESYIQSGIIKMLNVNDEELFPQNETENYQWQYAMAGKGLFGLMRRAIQIRAAEAGSALGSYDLAPFFAASHGTKTAGLIWACSLGASPEGDAKKIKALLSPEAFRELETLAAWIMRRCVHSMANSAAATIAKMGRAPSGRGHIVFFEGSVANDKYALPLLKAEIKRLAEIEEIYKSLGVEQPIAPDMEAEYRPVRATGKTAENEIGKTDLTSIGAVTMAMAENVRRRGDN